MSFHNLLGSFPHASRATEDQQCGDLHGAAEEAPLERGIRGSTGHAANAVPETSSAHQV